jgi:hypothetical protein
VITKRRERERAGGGRGRGREGGRGRERARSHESRIHCYHKSITLVLSSHYWGLRHIWLSFSFIIGGKHQKYELKIYSHREDQLCICNQEENLTILNRVRCDKMSGCHDRKGHEDKSLGPILCGLVLAQECAPLVFFISTIRR